MACIDTDQCAILSQIDTDIVTVENGIVLTNATISAIFVGVILYVIARYVLRFFDDAL